MTQLANNRKALFDYEIVETLEAGISLLGPEVKSVRAKNISLKGSYIATTANEECFLKNAQISPYKFSNTENYDPHRERKLLLTKKEIARLIGKLDQPGFAVVPLEVFTKGRLIKVKIAIGKGRKKFDKRHALKQKAVDRDVERAVKKYR